MKCTVGIHELVLVASWDHAPWAYGDIRQYLKPKDYLSMSWKCRHCPEEVIHLRPHLKNEQRYISADRMVEEYRKLQRELEVLREEHRQSTENTKGNQK